MTQQTDNAQDITQDANFPFTAIVGQERMKLALVLNAINPAIGGVLIRGEKGAAKSTAARSLAALLPALEVAAGCPYSCSPGAPFPACHFCAGRSPRAARRQVRLVELPVSATEEAVVGALDIEAAIREGSRRFEPGLLASAHRGILYIDEVNLLNDHVVDVLLDSAAMGRNFIEREGVSFSHPARFILIGTMNPEEGDLRPQFIDRFGLALEIDHIREPDRRAEIVRRRIAFEADPQAFAGRWQLPESQERERIANAVNLLPSVKVDDAILTFIARLCAEHDVDGLRADIVIYKAAQTLAAYNGREGVAFEDVLAVAEMALLHRMRRQPFDEPELNRERLEQMAQDLYDDPPLDNASDMPPPPDAPGDDVPPDMPPSDAPADSAAENTFAAAESFSVRPLNMSAIDRRQRIGRGRRTTSLVSDRRGRYVDAKPPDGKLTDLAVDATIRAAAPYQRRRAAYANGSLALQVEAWDLRQKVRESRVGNLVVFVVDASGSMGAQQRMSATKGAILSLLMDAYQRRDKVAMIAFRGAKSEVVLPPTGSPKLAQERLERLPTGGRTPMAQALSDARKLILQHKRRDPDTPALIALVSDCRANVGIAGGDPFDEALGLCAALREEGAQAIVLDPAPRSNRFGLTQKIAHALGGDRIPLDELRADAIRAAVRQAQRAEV